MGQGVAYAVEGRAVAVGIGEPADLEVNGVGRTFLEGDAAEHGGPGVESVAHGDTLLGAGDVGGAVDEAVGEMGLGVAAAAQHEAGGGAALRTGDEFHVGVAATVPPQCCGGLGVQLAGALQA